MPYHMSRYHLYLLYLCIIFIKLLKRVINQTLNFFYAFLKIKKYSFNEPYFTKKSKYKLHPYFHVRECYELFQHYCLILLVKFYNALKLFSYYLNKCVMTSCYITIEYFIKTYYLNIDICLKLTKFQKLDFLYRMHKRFLGDLNNDYSQNIKITIII